MQFAIVIIFLSLSFVQTADYEINNRQICTQRPFVTNFRHNCSRTRLTKDVQSANTNRILHITIIFQPKFSIVENKFTIRPTANVSTSLTITKSYQYNQTIYLTFLTWNGRFLSINNQTIITFNPVTINSYFYNTSSEQITQMKSPFNASQSSICILKNDTFLIEGTTRAYYLYTNETNLKIDLSTSSYSIPPIYTDFDPCYREESGLSVGVIVFIVVICVLSVVTIILVAFCLKKQLKELIHLIRNCLNQKLGRFHINRVDQ